MVVDARSLVPAPDLRATETYEMRGSFLCRRGHPLARKRVGVSFDALRKFPIASTPLSDEVARVLVERYGPEAHPQRCVTLHCEVLPSQVELTRHTDTVLIAIRAVGSDLVELTLKPALNATARFAIVTLAGRSEAPALPHRAPADARAAARPLSLEDPAHCPLARPPLHPRREVSNGLNTGQPQVSGEWFRSDPKGFAAFFRSNDWFLWKRTFGASRANQIAAAVAHSRVQSTTGTKRG